MKTRDAPSPLVIYVPVPQEWNVQAVVYWGGVSRETVPQTKETKQEHFFFPSLLSWSVEYSRIQHPSCSISSCCILFASLRSTQTNQCGELSSGCCWLSTAATLAYNVRPFAHQPLTNGSITRCVKPDADGFPSTLTTDRRDLKQADIPFASIPIDVRLTTPHTKTNCNLQMK
jgi:hypothetical protein